MRHTSILTLGLFAAACSAAAPGGDTLRTTTPEDTALPTVPSENQDSGPDTAGDPDDATWQAGFFSNGVVHDVVITLTEDASSALTTDPYAYTTAAATFDGEAVDEVGLRLRGKVGSFRTLDQKPKFKFDFGEFVDGQHFHGLKALALNNEVADCSYLREPVGYEVFRNAGVAASRTSFAHVTVNGQDYGLYVVVEVPDGKFLSDRFPDDDAGQLYDGKYWYREDGTYTMVDFGIGVDDLFQLEEGVDDGNAAIVTMSSRILASSPAFQDDLADRIDWDQVHRVFAVEQWVGHQDGYVMKRNNYRVYFRPSDGRLVLVPWDLDCAFLNSGLTWSAPQGSIAGYCWDDDACYTSQAAGMSDVLGTIETATVLAEFDAMAALIEGLATADPKRECTVSTMSAQQAAMRSWIEGRSAAMESAWGL